MSHPRKIRLPVSVAEQARLRAGLDDVSLSDWLRAVWQRRSDKRLAPLSTETEAVNVRLGDELLERVQAAADRAGLPLERWLRMAVEVELGYLSLIRDL